MSDKTLAYLLHQVSLLEDAAILSWYTTAIPSLTILCSIVRLRVIIPHEDYMFYHCINTESTNGIIKVMNVFGCNTHYLIRQFVKL